MANLTSIARPYALAAFESARDKGTLAAWKTYLEAASLVAKQPVVSKLLTNPEVTPEKPYDLFQSVLASYADTERNNFLRLLSQNRRLPVLPEIAELFNMYFAYLEKISTVRLVTAIDLEEAFRQKFAQALTKRVQKEVKLKCETDPTIIGGAIIHIGDRVIDGSIRGKLARLRESLSS